MERGNLPRRHALAPRVRKGGSLGKERERMRQRVTCWQAFYHCTRPHQSLRVRLLAPEGGGAGGIPLRWHLTFS
jgi:hypothetical protein